MVRINMPKVVRVAVIAWALAVAFDAKSDDLTDCCVAEANGRLNTLAWTNEYMPTLEYLGYPDHFLSRDEWIKKMCETNHYWYKYIPEHYSPSARP
jgi:hypothetical protein